jgi:hypothetical protein
MCTCTMPNSPSRAPQVKGACDRNTSPDGGGVNASALAGKPLAIARPRFIYESGYFLNHRLNPPIEGAYSLFA